MGWSLFASHACGSYGNCLSYLAHGRLGCACRVVVIPYDMVDGWGARKLSIGAIGTDLRRLDFRTREVSLQFVDVGRCCVINGMITLTNGLKPLVAYIVSCGDRKQVRRILWCAVSAVALGVAVFGMRAWMTGRGVGAGVEATLSWIPANRDFICEALGFFVRPVGVLQSCVIYPLVMWSAVILIRNRDFTLCESLCRCSPLMF